MEGIIMEFNEAIEKIKVWYQTYLANSTSIYNDDKAICGIIDLLQQGEKYKKIVEDLEENYRDHDYCIVITDKQIQELKQTYFPEDKLIKE